VTPLSGSPSIGLQIGAGALNPFGFGTGFGTDCDAFFFPNTYVVGDPADPCGNTNGVAGDWFDWDGALSSSGNSPPVLNAPATASGVEGTAIATITANATDPDAGNTLTITQTGMPGFLTFNSTPGPSPNSATITGTPGFSDAGVYGINWHVNDGTITTNTSTQLTIANFDRAPTLTQPANMTVNEGSTAVQTLTGSDPDNDPLTFLIVDGPAYMSVSTDTPTSGTVRLVPGFTSSGTAGATVQANDGTLFDNKSFTITVNNTDRAPILAQPSNMTVAQGATADQVITATDQDAEALTFSKVAGPTFLTVTTTSPGTGTGTGNIHLAAGASETTGTSPATVRASDGTLNSDKALTVTVIAGANQAPVLTQPANMTVNEGLTADQTLNATDADGQALAFSLVSGPTYASVGTTSPGTGTATGNIHLAPGFSDSGTATATVRASDGTANSDKSLTITVNNVNRAPTLNQPANMTVAEGVTADQVITGTDPDGDALTFSKVSGPTYLTVTTTNATTGNIHLAPGFSDSGTAAATVRASDGSLSNDKSLTVTVNNTDRAPTLNQPANMSVAQGGTSDQVLTGTDPDGDALTFSKVSGPTFMTVTTTNATTGNIHLAAGVSETTGTSPATVRASDGTLNSDKSLTVTVTATNQAPVLAQPANMTVAEGATADQTLNATDPDGNPIAFTLVSGPTYATVSTTSAGTGTATGNIHLAPGFSDSGTAAATVRASDGSLSNDKSLTITVNNTDRAPTLTPPTNMSVAQGATADQVLTGSDPDGDALTFSKVAGPTFMTVTTTNATTGNIHLAPGATETTGVSAASVRTTDGTLNSATEPLTVTVTATNAAPTLAQPANMTVNEGLTADQTLNATDPDGNPLSFTLVSGPAYASVSTTSAGTGTATGNIHLAPGFSDSGTAAATVRASDGSLNDDKSLTITVNNTNRAPTLNQPANMSVAQGGTADQVITGTDPDGDALTFSLVSGPTFASVTTTNATTGNIHLAAGASDPTGTSGATVRASDGTLNNDKTLTITVTGGANQAPVLAQPGDMTVNEGATADQVITATDGDGNPITFSKVSGPTFLTVSTTSPGTGSAMGNIHLAPGFSDSGVYGATVRASDGSLNSDKSLSVTVNNVNRAPTLDPISNMTVTEGATADQSITGSDPDGDALTFSKVTGPTFVTITTTNPTTGNVHVAPLTGDAAGSPYTVQARASDGTDQDTRIFSVTVRPPNRAPVLAQPSDMTVDEGATADQAITATDQDGDALSFTKVSGPTFLTVTTTSPGTGTGTGNIHLAPGFSDSGAYGATVRASDGSLSDDKSLTVTVNDKNRAPTLDAIANMTVTEGATADQTIAGSDPDGDALTFAKVTGPTFLTVSTTNPTTGSVHLAPVTGDAAGSPYGASASASDGTLSDTKGFTITVNPAGGQNHAPVLAQPNNMTVDEGATDDQTLTATDQDGDALSFTKVGGPTFLTVGTLTSTTGNAHLAPGFADAGTYSATVRASDGSLSDDKSFQITVNNKNRAPVADAGGPYSGIVGIPVAFDGTASTDPDGDALTYSWDFDAADGITPDATGSTPSHTYTVPGTFTVTLTVTDNGTPQLSGTDTATADITASSGFPANAFIDGGDRVIRLNSSKPTWCLELEPANHSFRVTDIIPSSILATFNGTSIHSIGKAHVDDGRLEVCFAKDQLRILFASLSNGRRTVTVSITGDLNGGGSFIASLDVVVVKTGGPGGLAKDGEDEGHGHHAFAFASPNPLNPSTTISFELSRPGSVQLNVYDVSGRLVKTLANGFMGAGSHSVGWDGTSRQGARVASGVYFYLLQTPEATVKSNLVVAK
jgi:hypothetical protein